MKKIILIIFLIKASSYVNAMTTEELNYLADFPKASKATVVLDYLFIEDSKGNILDQCFLPKDGGKNCNTLQSNKGTTANFLNAVANAANIVADSYSKQAQTNTSLINTSSPQPIPLSNSKTRFNCITLSGSTTCREQ